MSAKSCASANRVALALILVAASGTQAIAAGPTFLASTGSYYESVDTPSSWNNAITAAAAKTHLGRQGRLATISSEEENSLIRSLFTGGHDSYWLGGFQDQSLPSYSEPGGGWRWITNEPFTFTKWRVSTGEPNNDSNGPDCLEMLDSATWNDLSNNSGLSGGYIIEYPAPVPEPATIALIAAGAGALLLRRRRHI